MDDNSVNFVSLDTVDGTVEANLLRFLCEEWCQNETLKSALGTTHLYLSGGFKEETRSVVIKEGCVVDVPALESTQQEADTRVILHTIYSVQAAATYRRCLWPAAEKSCSSSHNR